MSPHQHTQARIDLAAAYRLAVRHDLHEGISNHFTRRAPAHGDSFLVLPHGLHWREVTASRLLLVDFEGRVIEGEGEVEPSALFIHSRLYRARPDVQCVFHTHMPYATTLAVQKKGRLLPISQNSLRFHGRLGYYDDYAGAVDQSGEGERLAEALGEQEVLFHAHHGVIVVGRSVARAWDDLYFVERTCQVQVLAQATGQPLRFIPDEVARGYASESRPNNLAKQADLHFAALKRLLDRDEPDYST